MNAWIPPVILHAKAKDIKKVNAIEEIVGAPIIRKNSHVKYFLNVIILFKIDQKYLNLNKLIDFALITLKFKFVSITKKIFGLFDFEIFMQKKNDELNKVN